MFAATCRPGEVYKGYDNREILTLKSDPDFAEKLRQEYKDIVPGFYMDKRNWNSIFLDGRVPEEVLKALCDHSYNLVFGKLTKKMQKLITEGN